MFKKLVTLVFALAVSSSAFAGLGFSNLGTDLASDANIKLCVSNVRTYKGSLLFEVACNGKEKSYWELGQDYSSLLPLIAEVYGTLKSSGMHRTCQDSYNCIFER